MPKECNCLSTVYFNLTLPFLFDKRKLDEIDPGEAGQIC